jgi:hypothetical protein
MDNALFQAFLGLLVVLGYFVTPAMLVWGWARWLMRPMQWTITSILSLIGFLLATTSAIVALCTIGHAGSVDGNFDPLMRSLFRVGIFSSLGGIVFGIGGVWRPSSLRWHSAISAVSTVALWLMMLVTD